MRGLTLVLICALSLAKADPVLVAKSEIVPDRSNGNAGNNNDDPSLAPEICAAEDSDSILVAHENCNKFYECTHGKPVEFRCYGNLQFNPAQDRCDWPENVDCGDRIIPDEDCEKDNNNGGNGDSNSGSSSERSEEETGGSGTCNCNPSEAPELCKAEGSEGVHVVHESCNLFYVCVAGRPVARRCPGNLMYNPHKQVCDWAHNVECGDRTICEEDNNESTTEHGTTGNGNGDNGGDGGGGNGGTCNCNPDEAPKLCAAEGSEGVHVAHEICNLFYMCVAGRPVAQRCPSNLMYNSYLQVCDWATNVECGDRTICEEDNNESTTEHGTTGNGNGDNGGDGGGGNGGTCNCNPGEAPEICAADGSEGVHVAHESCNLFYVCVAGRPVAKRCPANLMYNPQKQVCDWADNVNCGDRTICEKDNNESTTEHGTTGNGNGDNDGGGNGGTCNCNPGEAPEICAADGSEREHIAHENCNQFYVCVAGKPFAQTCSGNLMYNPYKQVCDWAENVECGDRVIPEDCEGDNESTTEHGTTGNGNGDNDGGGNGGTCNCNPGEAPEICAADGSEREHIAHENCNQFYVCVAGKPFARTCSGNLMYNPYKQVCDWADNVECGDRVIPEDCEGDNESTTEHGTTGNGNGDNGGTCNCNPGDAPEICAADGSEGEHVAHENCNQFYVCVAGKPFAQICSGNLMYNPYKQVCDWVENVECGDRVIPEDCEGDNESTTEHGTTGNGNGDNDGGGNGGTCNCNPGEAPEICAADGSEREHIAHENCNQFYVCVAGKPFARTCSGNLMYNPYKQVCDWAENVECGDRVIPEDCEGDNESTTEHGTTGNGNGDNDGDGNGGTCNCNPGEAPEICAADGSEREHIAHENCNQFYVCVAGKPFAQTCSGNLMYNPYKQVCDWAENVECGDRVIPEDCEGDNESTTEHGTTGNGNGDNDGGGNGGTCNCNPGEAPEICAADGSEREHIAHENCNQFYVCVAGKPFAQTCSGKLLYNPYKQVCDWADNVECGDRVIPEDCEGDNESTTEHGTTGNGNGDNGGTCNCNPGEAPEICAADGSEREHVAHENCNQFYVCVAGKPFAQTCSGDLLYNPYKQVCDWADNVECGDRVIPEDCEGDNESTTEHGTTGNGNGDNGGTCNCNPGEAPEICAADGSEREHIAHENCNQFYVCVAGKPFAQTCSGDLLYNPYKQVCDWAENVKCGDRVIPEDCEEDNESTTEHGTTGNGIGGTCNCNPGEAPDICAADDSQGELVAHENCHQFYVCVTGKPVVQTCYNGLMYNPYKRVCDWADNVQCGDRVIPGTDGEDCEDNDDSGAEDGNGNGEDEGTGGDGSFVTPEQAETICSKDGSAGIFLAHPNCNQFYTCLGGGTVVMDCPGELLYHWQAEICDWPDMVDCGDRSRVLFTSFNKHMEGRAALIKK